MNVFDNYISSVLKIVNKHNVEYMVVGGYAVNYHGYIRTTGDIDLWIKPDNGENKKKFIAALEELGIEKENTNEIVKMDFTAPLVFSDGEQPFKVDFMTHVSGVNFDEAWSRKIITEIDGISVPFVHLHHLVISKMSSDRHKDKIDVDTLQKIQQLRSKQNPTT